MTASVVYSIAVKSLMQPFLTLLAVTQVAQLKAALIVKSQDPSTRPNQPSESGHASGSSTAGLSSQDKPATVGGNGAPVTSEQNR